jgi:hypothetical protein
VEGKIFRDDLQAVQDALAEYQTTETQTDHTGL